MTRSRNSRFRPRDVLDRLPRNRRRTEAHEIAGMAGPHRDADLAVGLEAADAGPWPARGSTTTNGRFLGSISTPAGGMIRTSP